jgi:uncharacterized membrane protein YbhN (UPF0104 family)
MTDPTAAPQPPAEDTPADGDAVEERPSGNRRKALLSGAVGAVLGGAAMFLVVRTLVSEWEEAEAAIRDASAGWLVLAVVLAAAGMASIGLVWGRVLERFGVSVGVVRVLAWYFVGELGKYLPGGVWPVLGRGELARRGGVPRTRAYASVAMSLGMLYLAAMFVATAFMPFALSGGGFSPWMLCLLALPVGVVALHHSVIEWFVGAIGRITKRSLSIEVPRWKDSLSLVALYVPTWLFIGGATWAVARAITPDASAPRVMFAAVLSWVVGFLAVPVPAGAGVREAVLLAASGLDGGVAAATAIIARVVFVAVDAIGGLLGLPTAGRRRAGARVGPLPAADASVDAR